MFLFPLLHYGESMGDFEKLTFFHREVIFHLVRELSRAIFDVKSADAGGYKNRKLYRIFENIEFL